MWIGLIRVRQNKRNGVLGDADQAYSNAVGLAKDKGEFRSKIKSVLESVELQLLRLENAEPLNQRLSKYPVHKDIIKAAKEAKKNGQVAFSEFAAFDENGE